MSNEIKEEDMSIYKELIDICEANDIELVEAIYLDEDTSNGFDTINILTFRIFNSVLDKEKLTKQIEKLSDTEVGAFSTHYIADVLFVYVCVS